MTEDQLIHVYSRWTAQLHAWLEIRGRHLDCEFRSKDWTFWLYSGYAQDKPITQWGTVPGLTRPQAEVTYNLVLPTPEEDPSEAQLSEVFRTLCFAAARILEIDLGKLKLDNGYPREGQPSPLEADEP